MGIDENHAGGTSSPAPRLELLFPRGKRSSLPAAAASAGHRAPSSPPSAATPLSRLAWLARARPPGNGKTTPVEAAPVTQQQRRQRQQQYQHQQHFVEIDSLGE